MQNLTDQKNTSPLDSSTQGLTREPSKIEFRKHPLRLTIGVLFILVAAWFFYSIITNQNMRWDVVAEYLFAPSIMSGLWVTILLTIIAMSLGIILGIVMEIIRSTGGPLFEGIIFAIVNFTRSVPLLVQLIFWFNIGIIFPQISVGIPFTSFMFTGETNHLISGFTASIIGLSLHESVLMTEIIRGGILSVPKGQAEAAKTLGIPGGKVFARIVLPQAMRAIIPSTVNQLINLMKATAMVAFISGGDLMTEAQKIYSRNFLVIPLLIVVTIWYLVLTILASGAQKAVEKKYNRGFSETR